MSRSTKEKNSAARNSIEKSLENSFVNVSKNKYVVREEESFEEDKNEVSENEFSNDDKVDILIHTLVFYIYLR